MRVPGIRRFRTQGWQDIGRWHKEAVMAAQVPVLGEIVGLKRESGSRRLASAAPSDIRLRNRTAIMRALYPKTWLSRAQLAKITGMSKVSTSDVVAELIKDGLLIEGEYKNLPRPGKPALDIGFNQDAGCVVAMDLSDSTHIRALAMNLVGGVLLREELDCPPQAVLDVEAIRELCNKVCQGCRSKVIGIAVATPGTVNDEGLVIEAPNLGWVNMDLPSVLADVADCPVVVANDADAAVFAERYFAGGSPDMILVQIAKGIGAGVLISDGIVRGRGFTAGEIGHVVMSGGTVPCVCGKTGCLETMVSVPVLDERISKDPGGRSGILDEAGQNLGRALAMPVAMTNITQIVLSGPRRLVDETMVEATQRSIDALARSRFMDAVHVQLSNLGEDAAMLGAAAMVLRKELSVL